MCFPSFQAYYMRDPLMKIVWHNEQTLYIRKSTLVMR